MSIELSKIVFPNILNSRKWGILGDSIAYQRSSAIAQAIMAMGFDFSENVYAVSGSRIEEQASKIPAMVSDGVDAVFIQVGTNNVYVEGLDTVFLKYNALSSELIYNGIQPVYCCVPPQGGGYSADLFKINAALYHHAKKKKIPVFDPWTKFALVAGGWSANTVSNDGVHPAMSTRTSASIDLIDQLKNRYSHRLLARTSSDGLFTNPCFATDSDSNGVADGWSTSGSYGVFSLINDGDNGRKKQRIIATDMPSGQAASIYQTVTVGENKSIRFACAIDVNTPDTITGSEVWGRVMVYFKNSSNTQIGTFQQQNYFISGHNEIDFITKTIEGTAKVTVYIQMFSGSGYTGSITFDVSRATIYCLDDYGISL